MPLSCWHSATAAASPHAHTRGTPPHGPRVTAASPKWTRARRQCPQDVSCGRARTPGELTPAICHHTAPPQQCGTPSPSPCRATVNCGERRLRCCGGQAGYQPPKARPTQGATTIAPAHARSAPLGRSGTTPRQTTRPDTRMSVVPVHWQATRRCRSARQLAKWHGGVRRRGVIPTGVHARGAATSLQRLGVACAPLHPPLAARVHAVHLRVPGQECCTSRGEPAAVAGDKKVGWLERINKWCPTATRPTHTPPCCKLPPFHLHWLQEGR